MKAGLLALSFVALGAQAADVDYAVAARTDVRTRSPLPGDRGSIITGDVELLPDLLLGLRSRTSGISLQYNPSLLLREPQTLGPVTFLHRGRLTASTRGAHAGVSFVQEGAWGMADVGALRQPEGSTPGTLPDLQTVGTLPYVRSATALVVDASPVARVNFGVSAGYNLSGNPEGNSALPLQWGPAASARLRLAATRVDGFTTSLQGSAAWFSTGAEQLITTLTETWERQFSRTFSTTLGAGAAFTREVVVAVQGGPIPGEYFEVLPVVVATASWREDTQLMLGLNVRMAPFADRFTGLVYERVEARAQAEWRAARPVTVIGAAGLAYAVPLGQVQQAGDQLYFGEGSMVWGPAPWFSLGLSARVLWTEQPRLMTPGQLQWVGTISATVRERDSTAW